MLTMRGLLLRHAPPLRSVGGVPQERRDLGPAGEQLTELNGAGGWVHTNVFAAGSLLATYDSLGTHFALADWLGTKRIQASATGGIDETCMSLPFGDSLTCMGQDATEHHFTGKEHDIESGNEFFLARYSGSTMGRFLSPDPSGLEYADPNNPQSLNLYSYALNDPLKYTDPSGMYCDYSDHNEPGSGFDQSQFDYNSNSGECGTNGGQWVADAYTHNGADDANRPQYAVSSNTNSGNNPWTFTDFQAMYQAWNQGLLPQQLNYEPWSWESIDMSHNFAVNRARAAYIKAGCPSSSPMANGHVEAAVDSWGNVALGQPDWLELQIGGWSGTITTSGDTSTFTVNNPMSNSSFNGQSAANGGHSSDNPNGPNG